MIIRSLKTWLTGWRSLFVLTMAGMLIGLPITKAQDRVAYVRPENRTQMKDIQIQFFREGKLFVRTAEEGVHLNVGDYVRVLASGAEATVLAMDHTEIARVRWGQVVIVPNVSAKSPIPAPVMPGRTTASTTAPQPTSASEAGADEAAALAIEHTEQLNQMSLERARQGMDSPATGASSTTGPASEGGTASTGASGTPTGTAAGRQ